MERGYFDKYSNMERQLYKDATLADAQAKGFDTIQLKYDGWWSCITIKNSTINYQSSAGRIFKSDLIAEPLDCTLVGEHMHGTQWSQDVSRLGKTFVFDIWKYGEYDLANVPYRNRMQILKTIMPRLPASYEIVKSYPLTSYNDLWNLCDGETGFEGLVYRKMLDPVPSLILRQKRTITVDLKAVRFSEGRGRLEGTLGAITGVTPEGVEVDVGGGFTDEQRDDVWTFRNHYLGRIFEVEAKKKFESGSLRHPNFVRWRDDKL
jgi:hypothetical protein